MSLENKHLGNGHYFVINGDSTAVHLQRDSVNNKGCGEDTENERFTVKFNLVLQIPFSVLQCCFLFSRAKQILILTARFSTISFSSRAARAFILFSNWLISLTRILNLTPLL